MNRNIRVISLSLLLALVLSVFGIFASFAEEAAAPTEEYGTTIFDMDLLNKKSLNNSTGATFTKKTAADGSPYWAYSISGKDTTLGSGNGDYLTLATWSEPANIATGLDADGNPVTDPDKQKDTDFIVVDFDVSTDTTFIDGMYFHTCFYDDSYTHNDRVSNGNVYFDLDGAYNDALSIGLSGKATTTYAYNTYSGERWTDVTFVYDFRDTSKTVVYFYLNGIYAGKTAEINLAKQGTESHATQFYFIRLTTPVQSLEDANTNFANFTVKKFDLGYDGPLTDAGIGLGVRGATLDTMADLAYCLEDKPEEAQTKLATVTHSDGTSYDAYEFDELDANLVDGDVVTLYRDVAYPLIVPDGADITFKDTAGNILTPGTRNDGDLAALAETVPLDYSAGIFVTRDRKTMKTVTQLTDTDLAAAFDAKNKGDVIYTLLSDAAASFSGEGNANIYPILDLNGHTLELSTPSGTRAFTSGTHIRIANGSFVYLGGGSDFSMSGSATLIVFENLDLFLTKNKGSTFLDQRGGAVVFKDIKSVEREPVAKGSAYAGSSLSDIKSTYDTCARVIIDGCVLNTQADATLVPAGKALTSNAPFAILNKASSGIRYAGQNAKLTVVDTVANLGSDPLVDVDYYNHTAGTPTFYENPDNMKNELAGFAVDEASEENNIHNVKVEILNTDLSSTSYVVSSELLAYARATGKSGSYASVNYYVDNAKLHTNLDVTVENSAVKAATLIKAYNSYTGYDPEVNTDWDYAYNVNVAVEGESTLTMSDDYIVREMSSLGYEKLNIALDGELLLPNYLSNKTDGFTYSVAAPAMLVSRSDGTAVTATKLQSYPYIIGEHEYEFYWFEGETVSKDRIPVELPAATKYFSYKWAGPNSDGAYYAEVTDTVPLKANVTLYSDFTFNLYLPTDLGAESYETLTLNGVGTAATLVALEGEELMKVSIANISPAIAADGIELAFKVEDGSLETTVVKTVSVVDYLKSALNNAADETEAKLIVSMINYVEKAYEYVTPEGEALPDTLTELVASDKYKAYTIEKQTEMTATQTVRDLGVFESVRISLDNAFRFTFKTKAEFEGNLVFSYVKNGRKFVETKRCVGEREITIEFKANELLQNISVSYGDTTGEYNLAAYLEFAKTTEDTELIALVEALWLYADYAKVYVAAKS